MSLDNIKFSVDYNQSPTSKPGTTPFASHKGRQIVSFVDFEKRVKLIPMEENVRKKLLARVIKYPEASLDYVWTNLQSFIMSAVRECHPKSQVVDLKPLEEVIVEERTVEKPKVSPVIVRPSILEKIEEISS